MAKDVNNTQVVTEQDVNNTQVVTEQGVKEQPANAQTQDGNLADGTDSNKPVPYSRFKEEADAKKAAEEAQIAAEELAATAQRQLELVQMQKLADANPVQPKTSAEQALANLGLTADGLFGEDIVRFTAEKDRIDAVNAQQQQAVQGVQQFVINHSDINDVVGSVNPANGQIVAPNAEVLALVAKKPYLRQSTTEAIYDAVLNARKLAEFEKVAAVAKEHLDRQDIDTETQPLGGSAAGAGAAGDVQHQAWLSREQQQEIRRKVEAGEAL